MGVRPSEVISDPVGVIVELVSALEPALCSDVVEELVKTLAKSRATRRRLAQAISDRPGLLCDGRSPAPRVAGELDRPLPGRGRARLAAALRQLWQASADFPGSRRELVLRGVPNKAHHVRLCGKLRQLRSRNRSGEPLCWACPPECPDPMQTIIAVVTRSGSRPFRRDDHRGRGGHHYTGFSAAPVGLGALRPPRAAHRGRSRRPVPGGAPAHRGPLSKGGDGHRPARLSAIGRVALLGPLVEGRRACTKCSVKARSQRCARCGVLGNRPPATRTAGRCVPTAWSRTRRTMRSASAAAECARCTSARGKARPATPAGPGPPRRVRSAVARPIAQFPRPRTSPAAAPVATGGPGARPVGVCGRSVVARHLRPCARAARSPILCSGAPARAVDRGLS